MAESKITRNIIHLISRHKKLSAEDIRAMFKREGIYAGQAEWTRFTDMLLLSIGLTFLTLGAIFFFAYNWENLHKFVKLGMVGTLILTGILSVLLTRKNILVSNILLTGTSMLVGLLFSVFGQIYQTGADAYDFFLGWTVFIFLWAVISDFAVLWLMLILLINTTFTLYANQTGPDWSFTLTSLLLFLINVFALLIVRIAYSKGLISSPPGWFLKIVSLGAVFWMTISLVSGIFEQSSSAFWAAAAVALVTYTAAIWHSIRQKTLFLLCIIPMSVLIFCSALFWEKVHGDEIFKFFFNGICIIVCVTLLIRELLKLNKTWNGNS